jgi:molybdopterin adenylyltransferase
LTPRVAILTVSDSAVSGKRADASGPALRAHCEQLGWSVIGESLVADEADLISAAICGWADPDAADLILTTGGTGIAHRDVTPEATRQVLDREIPGIAELLRVRGLEQTKFSVVSRAVAGNRRQSLVINLPGSPAGAVFSLQVIEQLVPHMVNLLHGHTDH